MQDYLMLTLSNSIPNDPTGTGFTARELAALIEKGASTESGLSVSGHTQHHTFGSNKTQMDYSIFFDFSDLKAAIDEIQNANQDHPFPSGSLLVRVRRSDDDVNHDEIANW